MLFIGTRSRIHADDTSVHTYHKPETAEEDGNDGAIAEQRLEGKSHIDLDSRPNQLPFKTTVTNRLGTLLLSPYLTAYVTNINTHVMVCLSESLATGLTLP